MYWWLALPGAIAAYFLILRPILKSFPAFKEFYAEADTFWAKVLAVGGNSITIAWGYLLGAAAVVIQFSGTLADAFDNPSLNLKQMILDLFKDHPEYIGDVTLAISVITVIARLRSIRKLS